MFIFRCNGGIFYFNAEHVHDRFISLLNSRTDDVKTAIFFMGVVPMIDMAGVELLTELHQALKTRGIELHLVETHGAVRDALRRGGFEQHCGPVQAGATIQATLAMRCERRG